MVRRMDRRPELGHFGALNFAMARQLLNRDQHTWAAAAIVAIAANLWFHPRGTFHDVVVVVVASCITVTMWYYYAHPLKSSTIIR